MNVAYIELCRLRVTEERRSLMTPKLRGVRASMDKLRHALETDADKLAARIEDAERRRVAAFGASHSVLTDVERDLKEVEDFIRDTERGSNGGPTVDESDSGEPSSSTGPRSSEVAGR